MERLKCLGAPAQTRTGPIGDDDNSDYRNCHRVLPLNVLQQISSCVFSIREMTQIARLGGSILHNRSNKMPLSAVVESSLQTVNDVYLVPTRMRITASSKVLSIEFSNCSVV